MINDSPDSRIKASDAQTLWIAGGTPKVFDRLTELTSAHGLKAVSMIYLPSGKVTTHAYIADDRTVMNNYVNGVVDHQFDRASKGRDGTIVLAVRDDGVIDVATWGKTKSDCNILGAWGSKIMENLTYAPFTTWFGWGFDGHPRQMAPGDLDTLSEREQAYVAKYTHRRAQPA